MDELVFHVEDSHAGCRLDRYLCSVCPDISRSRIQSLIEENHVQVDGRHRKPSLKVKPSQRITIHIPDPTPVTIIPEPIPLSILYEDEHLVAVNKPRGMVVHPGAGVSSGTLVNALMAYCSDLSGIGGEIRPGIVHRLDRGTSGVILVAKDDCTHRGLSLQFTERQVKKIYRALVIGIPDWREKIMDAPIFRNPVQRKQMAIHPDGRAAVTHFNQLGSGDHSAYIQASPKTGRTHQIRVHLSALGFPVLGDELYGERANRKRVPAQLRARLKNMTGFCLHACQIEFCHPVTQETMIISAPEPDDFMEIFALANVVKWSETPGSTPLIN